MGKKVISVENVSKVYRLGEIGTGTLSSDVNRWWVTKVLGKEDPYLKIGQVNDRATKGENDIVYSLKDVSFEVEQGEVLGIIGKNGAGKSTLLKILSRITSPTTGRVRMKGRVASLLEVGTGFHPELTGRENIFLNGSILGMRKHEISRKLDEIIDFSGVERYIDTPVKRYSSGMYVRLAFAVAAHLESEILIVDEVLAVGDAEFQKKCLGRMRDVSTNEGRTVLFVSHNMDALGFICKNGIHLENGSLKYFGLIDEVILRYFSEIVDLKQQYVFDVDLTGVSTKIKSVLILNNSTFIKHDEATLFVLEFMGQVGRCYVGCAVFNSKGHKLFTTVHYISQYTNSMTCELPAGLLLADKYSVDFALFNGNSVHHYVNRAIVFQVVDHSNDPAIYNGTIGNLKISCKWSNA